MMDPDNRRPVNFAARQDLLRDIEQDRHLPVDQRRARLREWLSSWPDGRIKLALSNAFLALRRREPALFLQGSYEPVSFAGPRAPHLFGFARRYGDKICLVLCARFFAGLTTETELYPDRSLWTDCTVSLPIAQARLLDTMTGAEQILRDGRLAVQDLLAELPVAVLVGQEAS
jgi:(1->4)-alpha-D-glucan 1-alpha-D-glucosylmutase